MLNGRAARPASRGADVVEAFERTELLEARLEEVSAGPAGSTASPISMSAKEGEGPRVSSRAK